MISKRAFCFEKVFRWSGGYKLLVAHYLSDSYFSGLSPGDLWKALVVSSSGFNLVDQWHGTSTEDVVQIRLGCGTHRADS